MVRKILIGFVLSFIIIYALLTLTDRPTGAQSSSADTEILRKLEDIESGQQAILRELTAIKDELAIMKIRVTQNQ